MKINMVYGDRDFLCNCKVDISARMYCSDRIKGFGGENISLNIGGNALASFRSSGYANVEINSSYVGGVVRQSGLLSFSRVFQAGHEGESYTILLLLPALRANRPLLQSLLFSQRRHIVSLSAP
jgi:hypothetical protein